MLGHIGELTKVAFTYLLEPAFKGESHHLEQSRGTQVGGGIIESDMSILAETDERQVQGGRRQQPGITRNFRRQIAGVAVEIMDGSYPPSIGHMPFQPPPKGRGVVGRQADVLVHVKDLDPAPVEVTPHEGIDHGHLRVTCPNHHARHAAVGNRLANEAGGAEGRRLTTRPRILVQKYGRTIPAKRVERGLHRGIFRGPKGGSRNILHVWEIYLA